MSINFEKFATYTDVYDKLLSGRVYPEFFALPLSSRVVNVGSGLGPQMVMYQGQFDRFICLDLNQQRLDRSMQIAQEMGIEGVSALRANAEDTGLETGAFDVVVAIDVIEHVKSPPAMLAEVRRLIKPGGYLLVTYPTLHDVYQDSALRLARLFGKGRGRRDHSSHGEVWDPDAHNNHNSVDGWLRLTRDAGFELKQSRATTMFPPLHLFGVPKFWFKHGYIHAVDSAVCRLPLIKRYGQSLLCLYRAV